jgi:hypothetical protein
MFERRGHRLRFAAVKSKPSRFRSLRFIHRLPANHGPQDFASENLFR